MRSEKQVRKLGRKLSVGPIGKLPKESINQEIDRSAMYQDIDKSAMYQDIDKSAMYQEIDKSAMYQEIDKSNMCKKIYKNKAKQRRDDMLNLKVSINETVDKGL